MKLEFKYFFGMIAIAGTALMLSSCGSSKPVVASTPAVPDEVKVVM